MDSPPTGVFNRCPRAYTTILKLSGLAEPYLGDLAVL